MKKNSLLLFILFTSIFTLQAQVGIGTTSPTETLHVNGSARITVTNKPEVITNKLTGTNTDGTIRDIEVGENLVLKDNVLSAHGAFRYDFGTVKFNSDTVKNADLLIGPGEVNEHKTIIRIYNTVGDIDLTGISDGTDGKHIWLYPQDGELELKNNDASSSLINHIEANDKSAAKQYAMIELVYDGERKKWIIMQHHK